MSRFYIDKLLSARCAIPDWDGVSKPVILASRWIDKLFKGKYVAASLLKFDYALRIILVLRATVSSYPTNTGTSDLKIRQAINAII